MVDPASDFLDSSVRFAPEPRRIRAKSIGFGVIWRLIQGIGLGLGLSRRKSAIFRDQVRPETGPRKEKVFENAFCLKPARIRPHLPGTRPAFFPKRGT